MDARARAFDLMADAMLVVDHQRRLLDANPAALALFGCTRESLLARALDDLATGLPGLGESGASEGLATVARADGSRRVVVFRVHADVAKGQHLLVLREGATTEPRFAALADQLPFVVTRFDRQRRHLYVNAAITRYTGRAPSEIIGHTNEELGMPAELVAMWNDAIDAAFGGVPRELDFTWPTPDGIRAFTATMCAEGPRFGGVVETVLGITRDVTEERRTASALQQAGIELEAALERLEGERAMLNQLVEHLPVPTIVYAAPDFQIAMVNGAYRAIVKGRALVGKLVPEALPDVPTDSTLEHLREVARLKEPRTRREHAVTLTGEDGHVEERHYTSTFQPLCDESGNVTRIVAVNFDVTQEVRARQAIARAAERLRVVLDQMPVGVNVRDGRTGAVLMSNLASAQILGVDVRDRQQADAWRIGDAKHLDGTPLQPDEHAFRRVMLKNEPVRAQLVRMRQAQTGEEIVVRSSAVAISDGDAPLVLSVFQDVTEEHRLEAERALTLGFAEQFIGILGHDLRNPLNAIAMGTSLLRQLESGSNESTVRTLERVDRSVGRMTRMVDQLLDLTRARLAGGIPVDLRPTDLAKVVASAVDELTVAHPARVIDCRLPDSLLGVWDGDRLAQVISNIVGNAIVHGDPARPVTVTLAEEPGNRASLSVHSEGAPIPPAFLPILFDPFRRGQRDVNSKASGLGLGLFISRELVLAQGGEIEVASSEADGTTFRVTLPRELRKPSS